MAEPVVITGISCISSFGIGPRAMVDAIVAGRTGVRPITAFDTSECRSHGAAILDAFDPAAFIAPMRLRRVDGVGRLALVCASLLLDDAALSIAQEGSD